MPSSYIHLLISHQLQDFFKIYDLPSFYLGSISPDAMCFYKYFNRDKKRIAHFMPVNKDLVFRIKNINAQFEKLNREHDPNFLKGYIAHIYTDYLYSHVVSRGYLEDRGKITKYYQEHILIDKTLEKYNPDIQKIKVELGKSNNINFKPFVSASDIQKWKEMFLNNKTNFSSEIINSELEEPLIINAEFMQHFIQTSIEFIKRIYNNHNIEKEINGQYSEHLLIQKRMDVIEKSG